MWHVSAMRAPVYKIEGGRPARPWLSVWIDVSDGVIAHLGEGATLREALSSDVYRAATRSREPEAIHVCDAEVEEALEDVVPPEVKRVSLASRSHDLVDAHLDDLEQGLLERGQRAWPVVQCELVSSELRAALCEVAEQLWARNLGIEPTFAGLSLPDGTRRVAVLAELGLFALGDPRQLAAFAGDIDDAPPDALGLTFEPRRTLDEEVRSEIEEAEPPGELTELVPILLCTDDEGIPRPPDDRDARALLACTRSMVAWLDDPERREVDGVAIELISADVEGDLGLDGDGEAFQLKIALVGSEPEIWRRVVVPTSATLEGLHHVIQEAMGWQDAHLHQFTIKGQRFGADVDPFSGDEIDESTARLADVVRSRQKFTYLYDFGDSWEHVIKVEKTLKEHQGPACIDGGGACPPEDCGGIWGYSDMLQTLASPRAEGRQELLDWLGGDFDPAALDLEITDRRVRSLARRRSTP